MHEKKKNPLAKLGWLGLIGIYGVFFGAWWAICFFLFFYLFSFWNTTPDELFWTGVKKSAIIAFCTNIVLTVIGMLIAGYFSLYRHYELKLPYEDSYTIMDGYVSVHPILFGQRNLEVFFFHWIFIITLCTFFFSLMYYRHKEKKEVGEDAC